MRTRIFISHSAKDYGEATSDLSVEEAIERAKRLEYARWVRSAVVERLDSDKFDVWLDVKSLEPGDLWRARLSRWLGSCDGAVILLNEEAAASKWLRKEATILTWRRSLKSRVEIVPALLGGFRARSLEGIGLEDLHEFEMARLPSEELTLNNAGLLADQIVQKLDALTVDETETPMTEWVQDVAALFDDALLSEHHFRRAARLLGIDEDDLSHFPDRELTMAYHLLHADLDSAYDALVELKKGLSRENFGELVDLILPIWVDPEAARNLHAIVARSRERRALAINAKYQDTAEAYIMRAWCCKIPREHIVSATDVCGSGLIDELLPKYERALRRKLGLDGRPAEELQRYLDWDKELFILLGDGAIRADLVQAFREKYAKVTYVLLAGEDPSLVAKKLPDVELIRPELAAGIEENATTSSTRVQNLRGRRN